MVFGQISVPPVVGNPSVPLVPGSHRSTNIIKNQFSRNIMFSFIVFYLKFNNQLARILVFLRSAYLYEFQLLFI